MQPLEKIQTLLKSFFSILEATQSSKFWWIRVVTQRPNYTYYFGPFLDRVTAENKQMGFIEDLTSEDAVIDQVSVLLCEPSAVTVEGVH